MAGDDSGSALNARIPVALAIAGSDSGGGAGVQADLKTFAALGVHGASAITALTAQNTLGVTAIHCAPTEIVAAQIEAVLGDFNVKAVKIGMLGNAAIVAAVAECLKSAPFIIYDPVMTATSGDALSGAGFVEAIKAHLLPLVDCLTPNLAEAAALLGEELARDEADMARQGAALRALGPRAVLMKGGHLRSGDAVDLLVSAEGVQRFSAPRAASRNLHGTGCTLSSALAAGIVLGLRLPEAVARAKTFVGGAIVRASGLDFGAGVGPLAQLPLFDSLGDRRAGHDDVGH